MKFYKIEKWDYMDEYPTTQVMTFEDEPKAREYADYMNSNYSGGTTKLLGEMDSVEASNYCRHLYNTEKSNPQSDSHDFLLNVAQQYKKCYGEDVLTAEELIAFP